MVAKLQEDKLASSSSKELHDPWITGPSKLHDSKISSQKVFGGRGSGGVKSAGVSQSVRETGRDESQSVPSPEELFKTRDLELPIFEGSVPSCSPHSVGYTRTSVHPYFPFAKSFPAVVPWQKKAMIFDIPPFVSCRVVVARLTAAHRK